MKINQILFTLIFCSLLSAAPTQLPFLGAHSVDVAVKEVSQIPESSKTFIIASDLFFDFFKKPQSFENIAQCKCTQTAECSKMLTQHCKTLSEAKQIRKTSIVTYQLFFPSENFSCAIKLMTRKVDSQLFTTFTLFVPQKNAPEITAALINFCNAAIPRLSFMQKHSGKVYSAIFVACVGLSAKWYSTSIFNLRRKYSAYAKIKKITSSDRGADEESCFICTNSFKKSQPQWSTANCTCVVSQNSFFCEECILKMMVPYKVEAPGQERIPGDGRTYTSQPIQKTTCPICHQ